MSKRTTDNAVPPVIATIMTLTAAGTPLSVSDTRIMLLWQQFKLLTENSQYLAEYDFLWRENWAKLHILQQKDVGVKWWGWWGYAEDLQKLAKEKKNIRSQVLATNESLKATFEKNCADYLAKMDDLEERIAEASSRMHEET
jgi:hypothetical protein